MKRVRQSTPKGRAVTKAPAPLKTHRLRNLAFAALLVVIGAAAYANSLDGTFFLDDFSGIVRNQHIRQLWPPMNLCQSPTPSAGGRPVVALSFAVNYALGGLHVRGYHLFNIGVLILTAIALFGVVRRSLESTVVPERFRKASNGLALTSALLWMVHPLQTESVNYLSQRTESMMGLFYVLTLYCAIRGLRSRRSGLWHAASIAVCALGMASKQVMVTAPLMVVLYDCVFADRPFRDVFVRRRGLYAGLAATWAILATLMIAFPDTNVGYDQRVGPLDYAAEQSILVVGYLTRVFWPHTLIADYGYPGPRLAREVALHAVVLGILVAGTLALFRYMRPLAYCAIWFFAILAPTSTIVPIGSEVGAERRVYVPLMGLIVLLVVCGYAFLLWVADRASSSEKVWAKWPRNAGAMRIFGIVAVVLATTALATGTIRRNRDYASPVSLWRTVVKALPENVRALNNLGKALDAEGQPEEAIKHYRRAISLRPDMFEAHYNMGILLGSRGNIDAAIACYREALRLKPNLVQAHYNLGNAFFAKNDMDSAIEAYSAAVRLAPSFASAQYNLGIVLKKTGRLREALAQFLKAARLSPNLAAAFSDAAWILATHPDPNVRNPTEAVRLSQHALKLAARPGAVMLDTAAAAMAAAGQFDRAVKLARDSLSVARASNRGDLIDAVETRLQLYREGRAFVDAGPPTTSRPPAR